MDMYVFLLFLLSIITITTSGRVNEFTSVVKLLLKYGADVHDTHTIKGTTASDHAIHEPIVKHLNDHIQANPKQ